MRADYKKFANFAPCEGNIVSLYTSFEHIITFRQHDSNFQ